MKVEELKRFSLLAEFTEDDREELFALLEIRTVAAGEVLFHEGDESDALLLLASGELEIESTHRVGLAVLREGAELGAFSLLAIGRREATAIAGADCELAILARGGFRRLAEDAPRAACRLVESIVSQFAGTLRSRLGLLAAQEGDAESPTQA